MDFLVPIFVFVLVFSLCWCCKKCCCERRNEGAIFSTPVIITSETHRTTNGSFAVPNHGQTYMQVTNTYAPAPNIYSPQGYAQPPYPQAAPTYPTVNAPYPIQGQAPYPPPHQGNFPYPNAPSYPAMMDPPTYEQAVPGRNDIAYQKQTPYNPNFNS